MIKRIGIGVVAIVAGLGTGAGGAFLAAKFLPQFAHGSGGGHGPVSRGPGEFVPPVQILAPLVFKDGRLAGYTNFEVQIEVDAGGSDEIGAKMPLLLNAVNLRTYRQPLASGPDGMLPAIAAFRRIVMDAATEVYGKDVVRSVAVTKAQPA